MIRWPGRIEAGTTSNEIVHLVDMLPTLGRIAGYEVPDDRIIDGLDQLDFFLGQKKSSNREGFIVYNNDDIFGYKWRNWKVHLVALENMNSKPQPLNVPRIYNLITDPKEEYQIQEQATWVLPVVFKKIVEFQASLTKEPPIPMGTLEPYSPPD
jgi:arylsulfatase